MNDFIHEARSAADRVASAADRALRDARLYLASPQGQRLRANLARGLTTAAPFVAGGPLLRRSRLARLIGAAGVAAALVKAADVIRDWDPAERSA